MDRVPDFESVGCGFESRRGRLGMQHSPQAQLLRLLLARLERISADSPLAHRASGIRGGLLRELEKLEAGRPVEEGGLIRATESAFQVLREAARGKVHRPHLPG